MTTTGPGDMERLKSLLQPADEILTVYDVARLSKLGDTTRTLKWNKLEENRDALLHEFGKVLAPVTLERHTGRIALAQMLLADAARANGEQNAMSIAFNSNQMQMIARFEKYSAIDILPVTEIVEMLARHTVNRPVLDLMSDFYLSEYDKLDQFVKQFSVERQVAFALEDIYHARFDTVRESIVEYERKYGELPDALRDKFLRRGSGDHPAFVSADEALISERNFIARFDRNMNSSALHVRSPLDGKMHNATSWKDAHESYQDSCDPQLPVNARSRYILRDRRFGIVGEKAWRVVIEAVSFNHLEDLRTHGFDTRRATLADFLAVVDRFTAGAETGNYLHVLGIASPTGWDQRVIDVLTSSGFSRSYVSRHISVCLLDSKTGALYCNPQDTEIGQFTSRFKQELASEHEAVVRQQMEEGLRLKGLVIIDSFITKSGETRALVLKIANTLADEGKASLRTMKGTGLVLEGKHR